MVVHPAPGHYSGTVANALLYHCKDSLSGINGVMRPGIVHRIDQDTTGVIVACKNDISHNFLAAQFKEHSITRTYHAIVHNHVKEEEGTVRATIGRHPADRKKMAVNVQNGKDAVTHYKVLDNLDNKCPFNLEGQTLHAKTLGFIHPSTKKYMEFEAPLPDYFKKLLEIL